MTGSGTSAALGFPDYGLTTLTEMVENAGIISRAVDIPLIADADTGYGNELNVTRTVREYEARNVAGIHIEDQVSPKRCGHLDGKEVLPREAYLSKIRAAVAARRNPDFVIIARTDARAVNGLADAIDRANGAIEAGADLAFVEAAQNLDEMAEIPRRVQGPCLLNMVVGGKTPLVSISQAEDLGYRVMIMPGILLRSAIATFDSVLASIRQTGMIPVPETKQDVAQGFRRFGADKWDEIRTRYAAPSGDASGS
jgi:2-methylisocitrate lyase-like PEP mutase family enzyme